MTSQRSEHCTHIYRAPHKVTSHCPGTLTPQITFLFQRKPDFPGNAMTFPCLQGGDRKAATSPWMELLDPSADVWLCATRKMSLPAGSSKQVINARLRIFFGATLRSFCSLPLSEMTT